MRALVKVLAFILAFAAVLASLHFVIHFVFHQDSGFLIHHGAGQLVFYVLFILNVFIFQMYVNKESILSLGLKPYSGWYITVLKGWSAGAVAFVSYSLLMGVFGIVQFQFRPGIERFLTAFFVAFSAFAIALTEEILFRGFFLQTMLKDMPKWLAVTMTGVIFIFFHDLAQIQKFWTDPWHRMLAGGLFSLNILLCVAYLKTRMLYLPIGIHSGLVFAKLFFLRMKLIHIVERNSYLWGVDGDARRGFLAWLLFLAGIFILRFLITERERKIAA